MDWIQVVAGAGSIIGSIVGFLWYFMGRIEKDVGRIEQDFGKRMDSFERRMDGHAARIDQLYSMFVQLLKEGRK